MVPSPYKPEIPRAPKTASGKGFLSEAGEQALRSRKAGVPGFEVAAFGFRALRIGSLYGDLFVAWTPG